MAACFALSLPALAAVEVVDGDTIRVDRARVRMWGYDAPERLQTCMINGVERVMQRLGRGRAGEGGQLQRHRDQNGTMRDARDNEI